MNEARIIDKIEEKRKKRKLLAGKNPKELKRKTNRQQKEKRKEKRNKRGEIKEFRLNELNNEFAKINNIKKKTKKNGKIRKRNYCKQYVNLILSCNIKALVLKMGFYSFPTGKLQKKVKNKKLI